MAIRAVDRLSRTVVATLTDALMDDSLRSSANAMRARLRADGVARTPLLESLLTVPPRDRDAWVDALLGIGELPTDAPDLPRDAVPYLPCGVDEILAVVREVPISTDDVLVDLGAGLGRVAILVHLLSAARTQGVELQAPLVRSARACCAALRLDGVTFTHGDVAETALEGSVFFLYTPFAGATLTRALARLEEVARRRPIVVCAVGFELPRLAWLLPRERADEARSAIAALTIFDSRVPGVPARMR